MEIEKNVSEKIMALSNFISKTFVENLLKQFEKYKIESPIEQIFYATYYAINMLAGNINSPINKLIPQYKIDNYRVDFLYTSSKNIKHSPERCIAIELDGHEFHDTTESQRQYEKERDRYLTKKGYKIFHYTGKEVVEKCTEIINEIALEQTKIEEKYILEKHPIKNNNG